MSSQFTLRGYRNLKIHTVFFAVWRVQFSFTGAQFCLFLL